MPTPRILAFAGSLRRGSYNKSLAALAAKLAREAGAEASVLDLRDLPLPVYDEDVEKQGLPPNARALKDLMLAHQGFLIASPEYNSSVSAALKNAIDWASRPATGPDGNPEPPLACFQGKVAGIMSASPGVLGGLRGLVTLRSILGNIGVIVLPEQVAVTKANEGFDPDTGLLRDAKQQATLEKLVRKTVDVSRRLSA
jgi:NAD(P)H-dependent FMN reductase